MLDGRPFETADHVSALGNVVISRSAAQQLWPGQPAVGRRLQQRGLERLAHRHWRRRGRDAVRASATTPQALVYYPLVGPTPAAWRVTSPAYVLKTSRAEMIAPDVRALVREVAPEAPMYRVYTMAGLAARSMIQLSFTVLTLGIVSALALFLGALGLYGVLSFAVAERTREIGVRMALGASAAAVRRMVVGKARVWSQPASASASRRPWRATRALASLLFGVAAVDGADLPCHGRR